MSKQFIKKQKSSSNPSLPLGSQLCVGLRLNRDLHSNLYFDKSPILIGRGESCDLQLPYPWVSLQHIELHWSEIGICARDLYAKTPARVDQAQLATTLSEPRQELVLHLPSISLHCSISVSKTISPYTHEQLLWHLWKPESGWLMWSLDSADSYAHLVDSKLSSHLGLKSSLNSGLRLRFSSNDKGDSLAKQELSCENTRDHNQDYNETATYMHAISAQPWLVSKNSGQDLLEDDDLKSKSLNHNFYYCGQYWFILNSGKHVLDYKDRLVELEFYPTHIQLNYSANTKRSRLVRIEKYLYRLDLGGISVFISKTKKVPYQLLYHHSVTGLKARLYTFFIDRLKF